MRADHFGGFMDFPQCPYTGFRNADKPRRRGNSLTDVRPNWPRGSRECRHSAREMDPNRSLFHSVAKN